jgi:alpha-galactosidase
MNRRIFLQTGLALCGGGALRATGIDSRSLRNAPSRVVPVDRDAAGVDKLAIERDWRGEFCRSKLVNRGQRGVRVHEVVLFDVAHDLPPDTHLYGESFQMLSQTGGTLANPVNLAYSELQHYKVPQPEGVTALTGLMTLTPPAAETLAFAFTSCRRFQGRFYLPVEQVSRPVHSFQVVIDTEGLEIAPGATWDLEEFFFASGERQMLLRRVADAIAKNHPSPLFRPEPTGWCSWYCFGPRVTSQNVLASLDVIAGQVPALKYVQIDDGYQAAMGDWLVTGKAFGGDILGVLKEIHRRGFEPAIWVAPFIAEENSQVFREHPEWFLKDESGKPLPSNRVSFGGWRHGPWYVLDGTHPSAQKHLEDVFRTMRREWGCTYFKMDANFWGALHGGRHHDPQATRVEAYRRGMEAIHRGSGDAFLLGCNHPIWASFGLIHGSRSSDDIKRTWAKIRGTARQTFFRNWQNGKLWWNDPDAICLAGDLSLNEFMFHATACYASGGMALSGDDLSKMPPDRMAILKKLVPPTGIAAEFEDDSLRVGWIRTPRAVRVCIFNWTESPETTAVRLAKKSHLKDFWTSEDLGAHEGDFKVENLAPHSARLLEIL